MSITEQIYADYLEMVQKVASDYANKYRMVDRQDIKQELWVWFLKHPNKVRDWQKLDRKDSDRLIAKSLRNAAHDYCLTEKAKSAGYEREDVFWYRKDFVKIILPAALSNDWKRVESLSGDNRGGKSPAESNDWIVYAADVRKAYALLDLDDQLLVMSYYVNDQTTKDLHEQYGSERPTEKATAMAANRALNKMVKALGGFPPFKDKDYSEEGNPEK